MIRMILWTTFWLCTLCALTIRVKYSDGLEIKLKGWGGVFK